MSKRASIKLAICPQNDELTLLAAELADPLFAEIAKCGKCQVIVDQPAQRWADGCCFFANAES
jgi:hypothetical protein